jgi:hypothetical protein
MPCPQMRSRWREQKYLFRELVSALIPPIGLKRVIATWPNSRQRLLSEPRRRQKLLS